MSPGPYALDQYGLTQTVAPAAEPVTVEQAKTHCRVDEGLHEDDGYIERLIKAARSRLEKEVGGSFVTQTWKLTLDRFPTRQIFLPRGPVQSVTSVKYYDTLNTLQTLSSSMYEVDTSRDPARLTLTQTGYWPALYVRTNAVEVTYVAGFGGASAVPAEVRHAILMTVAHWYESREPVLEGARLSPIPMSVEWLMQTAWNGSYG